MKQSTITRIDAKDFDNHGDDWSTLLQYLNSFIEDVNASLSQIDDPPEIHETQFKTSATYTSGDFQEIKFSTSRDAKELKIMQITTTSPILNATSIDWINNNGMITIRYVTGLQAGQTYKMRVGVI